MKKKKEIGELVPVPTYRECENIPCDNQGQWMWAASFVCTSCLAQLLGHRILGVYEENEVLLSENNILKKQLKEITRLYAELQSSSMAKELTKKEINELIESVMD